MHHFTQMWDSGTLWYNYPKPISFNINLLNIFLINVFTLSKRKRSIYEFQVFLYVDCTGMY